MVVGGSLGGVNAALWLGDAGWDVRVLERSSSPLEGRGAGIVLHPATVRWLIEHRQGSLADVSAPAPWLRYLDGEGSVVHQSPSRYRFTSWTTLYRRLLACLDRERYRMGAEVTGVDATAGGFSVRMAGGEVLEADLLVAADGVASTVRSILLPGVRPTYAGYVAWRGTLSDTQVSGRTFALLHEAITYHVMPRSHILSYPIPGTTAAETPKGRRLNWVWYRNVADGEPLDDLMTDVDGVRHPLSLPPTTVRGRHLDELAAAAERLPPPLAEMVTATTYPFVQLIVDIAVPRMVVGRTCLMGDAAFALRPHAAAGTAKAAEDAWVLARELSAAPDDVPAALARWERRQLRLGRQVQARTCDAGHRSQVAGTWVVGDPLPFGLHAVGDSALGDAE